MTRECGECSECCKYFAPPVINHGNKKRACQHLAQPPSDKNCTLQAHKPTPCRKFKCGWLQGLGLEGDRPDKSGVVMLMARPRQEKNYALVLHEDYIGTITRMMETKNESVVVMNTDGEHLDPINSK